MEITIPWAPVKAMLHLAGKADIRRQINGVWIDRQAQHLVIWATTGHILGAVQTEESSTEGPDVLLPRHIVEACKDFTVQATVTQEADGRMSISCMGTTHYWKDEDLRAPDWRRVVPARTSGIAQQLDARLFGDFLKARKALGRKDHPSALNVAHNGGGGAAPNGALVLFRDAPEFIGVFSPIPLNDKGSAFLASAPDWVRLRQAAQADEACELA